MNESYASWGKFAKIDGHITHEMLNEAYGEHGMFFKKIAEAEEHQKKAGGIIYPIKDYFHGQVHTIFDDPHKKSYRVVLDEGAKPHIIGYLVSHPKSEQKSSVHYIKRKH